MADRDTYGGNDKNSSKNVCVFSLHFFWICWFTYSLATSAIHIIFYIGTFTVGVSRPITVHVNADHIQLVFVWHFYKNTTCTCSLQLPGDRVGGVVPVQLCKQLGDCFFLSRDQAAEEHLLSVVVLIDDKLRLLIDNTVKIFFLMDWPTTRFSNLIDQKNRTITQREGWDEEKYKN